MEVVRAISRLGRVWSMIRLTSTHGLSRKKLVRLAKLRREGATMRDPKEKAPELGGGGGSIEVSHDGGYLVDTKCTTTLGSNPPNEPIEHVKPIIQRVIRPLKVFDDKGGA